MLIADGEDQIKIETLVIRKRERAREDTDPSRRQESGWVQGAGRGIDPRLLWKGARWTGAKDNDGLVGLVARRGLRSAQLAFIFSLNDDSRSAKGEGCCGKGSRSQANSWAKAWEGIKCIPNAARG